MLNENKKIEKYQNYDKQAEFIYHGILKNMPNLLTYIKTKENGKRSIA